MEEGKSIHAPSLQLLGQSGDRTRRTRVQAVNPTNKQAGQPDTPRSAPLMGIGPERRPRTGQPRVRRLRRRTDYRTTRGTGHNPLGLCHGIADRRLARDTSAPPRKPIAGSASRSSAVVVLHEVGSTMLPVAGCTHPSRATPCRRLRARRTSLSAHPHKPSQTHRPTITGAHRSRCRQAARRPERYLCKMALT